MLSEDIRNLAVTMRWHGRHGLTAKSIDHLSQRLDALADQARALEGGHVPEHASPAMLDNLVNLSDRRGRVEGAGA